MKIRIKPNKKLFTIFLLINAAGYNYETNTGGMHSIRKQFREKIFRIFSSNLLIKKFIRLIRDLPLPSNEYIRLANWIMLPQKNLLFLYNNQKKDQLICQKYSKIIPVFNQILKLKEIKKLFQEYCNELKFLSDYQAKKIVAEFQKVLRFFLLSPRTISLNIYIHINLLDSYNRGTNYYYSRWQYISCSLDINNKISWKTIRHEFMHLLLKKIFKDDLKNKSLSIPVNKNYVKDNLRVKFEENFILATNLFFITDQKKRNNNLRFYYDKGYKKIFKFYNFIEDNFSKSRRSLSSQLLNYLIQKL